MKAKAVVAVCKYWLAGTKLLTKL